MRGSKRQKGASWELRYKGHSRTVKASGARRAGALLKDFCDEIDAAGVGQYKATTLTVPELVERWVDLNESELAPTTVVSYRAAHKHIRQAFESTKAHALTPADLTDFYRNLRKRREAATVLKVHMVVSQAYDDARDEGLIWGENPAKRAKRPKLKRKEMSIPTVEEKRRLVEAAEAYGEEIGALVTLALSTGMRRGELCALRWSRVDLEAGTVEVARALSFAAGKLIEKSTKTETPRNISLDAGAVQRLRAHREFVENNARVCKTAVTPDAYVFSTSVTGDEPYHPNSVSQAFRRVRNRAGISQGRFHDLRHFHGTHGLASGVDIRTMSNRLGHTRASTTLDIYAHALPAKDQEAAETIAEATK